MLALFPPFSTKIYNQLTSIVLLMQGDSKVHKQTLRNGRADFINELLFEKQMSNPFILSKITIPNMEFL